MKVYTLTVTIIAEDRNKDVLSSVSEALQDDHFFDDMGGVFVHGVVPTKTASTPYPDTLPYDEASGSEEALDACLDAWFVEAHRVFKTITFHEL